MEYNLRIAVVTETYPPEVNGVARTIRQMVRGALQRGDSVELIRPRQPQDELPIDRIDALAASAASAVMQDDDAGGIHLQEVLVPGLPVPGYEGIRFGFPVRARLLERWRRARPDVVQVVTEGPLGWAAVSAARKLGIPVVGEYHTHFSAYSQHYGIGRFAGLISRYLRYLHNRCDCTLVPTQALAGELRAAGYRRVEVVARGVDMRQFSATQRRNSLRTHWGVTSTALAVIYVGRLAAEKNIDLVLRTFDSIRLWHPDSRLILVGDGPLRREIEEYYPHAIFAGMRHGADLAAHYASADLFLFPSLTETYGNVVTEALACGLPVVAYCRAAAAELIRDGINGMLAAPGDEEGYERAARELASSLRTEANREAYGRQAADSVAELDWQAISQRMGEVFQRLIDPITPVADLKPPLIAARPGKLVAPI